MKLNTKFLIIVAITVLMVILLSFSSVLGSRRMTKLKQYQYVQTKVTGELSEVINYLNDMDYRPFQSTVAYKEWSSKISTLDKNFDYLLHDSITATFDDTFTENLESTETLWELLKEHFEPVEDVLQQMQEIKVTTAQQNDIQTYGIREVYSKNPEDEQYSQLYTLVLVGHKEVEGIIRSKNTLAKLNNQTAVKLVAILARQEKLFNISSIALAVFASCFLAILILIVTTNISRRIKSIQDVTEILARKDFSVDIKPNGSAEMYSLMENINKMVDQINDFFVVVKTTASKAISSGYTINDSATSTAAASVQIEDNLDTISKEFAAITETVQRAVTVISEMNMHIDTLVQNNETQTAALEETTSSVNEVVETLEYMNNMAIKRTQSAQEMHALVSDGDAKITSTKNVLNEINSKLDEVREVVTIINGVANKTNLLSMNAAIESAHAGEAGKGFAVVAAEIRSLAEATQKNSVRISDVVTNIINSVSQANESSKEASVAFGKVSTQAEEIISSLQEITSGIGRIDSQMHQIKDKTSETNDAADHINTYCGDISQKQLLVSKEVDSMNDLFVETTISIRKMKKGTQDIVSRMKEVSESSKESYKNMTDLENILEQFTTKKEVDEAVEQSDAENTIDKAVSAELADLDNVENFVAPEGAEPVVFNLEDVEEYQA